MRRCPESSPRRGSPSASILHPTPGAVPDTSVQARTLCAASRHPILPSFHILTELRAAGWHVSCSSRGVGSRGKVERILGRLLTDEGFQEDFFRDPARARLLLGLQLAADELEALLRIPRPALANLAGRLDGRICRLHIQRSEVAGQGE